MGKSTINGHFSPVLPARNFAPYPTFSGLGSCLWLRTASQRSGSSCMVCRGPKFNWLWINTYENTIFSGMNIHFIPAILMWTKKGYYWFWHTANLLYFQDYLLVIEHISAMENGSCSDDWADTHWEIFGSMLFPYSCCVLARSARVQLRYLLVSW